MIFPGMVRRGLMVSAFALSVLFGCVPTTNLVTDSKQPSTILKLEESHRKQALWQALEEIRSGDLKQANVILNQALSDDPSDANMHFLNAYVYEIRSADEGLKVAELAPAGYLSALNSDPLHWPAAYRLGLWHIGQRDYDKALAALGEAALIKDNSAEIFNALAVASYHTYELDAAKAFLRKAADLSGDTAENVRARAIVNAALNNKDDASKFLELYDDFAPDQEVKRLNARLRRWSGFHDHLQDNISRRVGSKLIQNAQFFGGQKAAPVPRNNAPAKTKASPSSDEKPEELKKLPGMLVIDAVIIRQKTSVQESRGKNLMNVLSVTLSGSLYDGTSGGSAGFANNISNTFKAVLGNSANAAQLTYSLNIANNTDSRTEVLARPSITVLEGETGTFFLGEEVQYSADQAEAEGHTKEVGISFEVTPEIVDTGKVRLEVKAEYDTFTGKDTNVSYTLVVATLKNKLNSTAILDIGQTLVLGGGTQEEKTKTVNSTPILGQIPGLQYFFSERVSVKTNTSLIFLITPRLVETIDDKDAISDAVGENGAKTEPAIMSQLRRRFRAWFDPSSNLTKALIGLSQSDLYREFRDGDLKFNDSDSNGKFDRLLQNDGNLFLNTYEEGFGAELLRYFYFD